MGVYCVIALVFVHVVLGHGSQGTDDRAVKLPTCQEITSAIAINQLTLLKMMGGGSHPSTGMAEMEELREEAAARDAKLQEFEKVIQDIKAMIENDVQETLKGMTDREAAAAAARDASLQEMKKVLESLQEEQQNLRAFVENAKQETLNRMASLEQELLTKVTSLEQELVTKVTSQACPDGWLHHESSCYLVDGTYRTWDNSLEYCKGRGGDLAKITSAEEQEFIKAHWGTNNYYWIGLNDRETEGRFVWTDGTLPTYTRWDNGEPDVGEGEDCVTMYMPGYGKWNDYPCSYTAGAVCERPVHA